MANCFQKAKNAFANETGNIAASVEKALVTGAPNWILKRVKPGVYKTSQGSNPRHVRMHTVPPSEVDYRSLIPDGDEARDYENPVDGETISGMSNKVGGADLPAEEIQFGYEEFTRCLKGKALETPIFNIVHIMEKWNPVTLIETLRRDLPRYGKEQFGNSLLHDVETNGYLKVSVAEGLPLTYGQSYFACIPTGGPNLDLMRHAENFVRQHGWDEGSETPSVNGRPAVGLYMGRDAIRFAISQSKKDKGLVLHSTLTVDDKDFGQTETYDGFQMMENPLPPRGYVVRVAAGQYRFRRISPWVVDGGVAGLIKRDNPDYWRSFITVGGESHVVMEMGYIVHPNAMERQAMGEPPVIGGKSFKNLFNFEVRLIDGPAVFPDATKNKDNMFFQYRLGHTYAPQVKNPELMVPFLYIAPTPQVIITNPNSAMVTAANEPLTIDGFRQPKPMFGPCASDTAEERDPTSPTCSDLFPTNGVGVMQFRQAAYEVSEDSASVTLLLERVGGNTGAASLVITITEGTALEPENFDIPAGFAGTTGVSTSFTKTITWADGVAGTKTVVVPINSAVGDNDGFVFTAALGTASGATINTDRDDATVTILDEDEAA